MLVNERELWLLNFYRNSELHGALFMGRLARVLSDTHLLVHATEHCATEARHAALLSQLVVTVGGRLDPGVTPVQEHYARAGGVPKALADLLVLSEVLEHRVLATYTAHLDRADVHAAVRETLSQILHEMQAEHGGEHAGWLETALSKLPADDVEAAEQKWRAVDRDVAAELTRDLDARDPDMGDSSRRHGH
jgi:hypothetical protein